MPESTPAPAQRLISVLQQMGTAVVPKLQSMRQYKRSAEGSQNQCTLGTILPFSMRSSVRKMPSGAQGTLKVLCTQSKPDETSKLNPKGHYRLWICFIYGQSPVALPGAQISSSAIPLPQQLPSEITTFQN